MLIVRAMWIHCDTMTKVSPAGAHEARFGCTVPKGVPSDADDAHLPASPAQAYHARHVASVC